MGTPLQFFAVLRAAKEFIVAHRYQQGALPISTVYVGVKFRRAFSAMTRLSEKTVERYAKK